MVEKLRSERALNCATAPDYCLKWLENHAVGVAMNTGNESKCLISSSDKTIRYKCNKKFDNSVSRILSTFL